MEQSLEFIYDQRFPRPSVPLIAGYFKPPFLWRNPGSHFPATTRRR